MASSNDWGDPTWDDVGRERQRAGKALADLATWQAMYRDYVGVTDGVLHTKSQRIQELEEQVASLQRVIQHKRDSDSVVDA
jgi:hypothetical protein